MKRLLPTAALTGALLLLATGTPACGAEVDFGREIRPLLSDHCFACHGPDEKARKAGLRLDLRETALQPLRHGRSAIVPGDPDRSTLIHRVFTDDEDDVMPPPSAPKQLSADQKEALRRWIAAGAPWPEHWAFVPPERATPPTVQNAEWPRNDVDRFVLKRLEQEHLDPAPRAPKTTLIRRASLDLTGLPPTVDEVNAFLADRRPDAYERLVDRLLASPRYGEHLARYWLDAVRYADSHGYHIDAQRDIWAYRDWVIRAFNRNQPFDQFTREQLAGDLLPNPTTDQKIATGYIRSNMSTGEGGVIEAEYASKYAFDRVETTSATWLGLTMVCARCHTHKYDPITHQEYYGLYAFFNQLDEPVMDGNRPNPDPFLKLPSPEQTERLAWLETRRAEDQTRAEAPHPALDNAQETWTREWRARLASGWQTLSPTRARSTREPATPLEIHADQTFRTTDLSQSETNTFELLLPAAPGLLAGLRLEALPAYSLPARETPAESTAPAAPEPDAPNRDPRFRLAEIEAELVTADTNSPPQKLPLTLAVADAHDGDHTASRAVDGKPDTAWSVAGNAARESRTAVFALAHPVTVNSDATLRVRLRFESQPPEQAVARFRLAVAQGDELVRAFNPPRLEPWRLIGPFRTEGLNAGFDATYPPETQLDLAAAYPGVRGEVRWHDRADLADSGAHQLVNDLHGVHGAYYLTRKIQAPAATRLDVTLRADDVFKLWLNGQRVAEQPQPERFPGVQTRLTLDLPAGESQLLLKIVNHQGAKTFAFSAAPAGMHLPAPDVAALLSLPEPLTGPAADRLRTWFRRQHDPEFCTLFNDLARWREEEAAIQVAIPTTLIAKERAELRDTFLLLRGEYDQPGAKVAHAVPAILPPFPADVPTNRLGLAEWLLRPDHPLTARVTVNRLWQQLFGVGIVKTTEDFGVQGEPPSHPELLDWLATEFVRSGWDVKHLTRLIVTSATYRQSSRLTPELLQRDPENRLLARGSRFRVDAEVLRDSALFVGGLLVEQLGGPSVKPYEPPGLWEAVSFNNSQKYVPDQGPAQYRRGLYTFWKRQSPPPNLLLFDAPTREYCVVKRPRTNTPLQALALLNDPQFVEASRALAVRLLTEGGERNGQRLAFGFRLVTGRKPDREELEILREVLRAHRAEYRRHVEAARAWLSVGDFPLPAGLDPVEVAAWTAIANLLLNLDEAVTKG
jgi:mono/diheme cytochrome c family protein